MRAYSPVGEEFKSRDPNLTEWKPRPSHGQNQTKPNEIMDTRAVESANETILCLGTAYVTPELDELVPETYESSNSNLSLRT